MNQYTTMMKRFGQLFFVLFLTLGVSSTTHAADPNYTIRDSGYQARYVSQSIADPITIEAGEMKLVAVRFKNTGTAAWNNDSGRYISAYTVDPRYRNSPFYQPAGWNSPSQIGRMTGTIAPGETGELGIFLRAPETPGTYKEEFHLAAENYSWVDDGYFYLDITVVPKTTTVAPEVPKDPATPPSTETSTHSAKRIMQSKQTVSAAGGEQVKLILGYQNTGETTWPNMAISTQPPVQLASSDTGTRFADESWLSSTLLAKATETIAPFDVVRKTLHFRAPASKGEYTLALYVTVDGETVDTVEIPVSVTSNAGTGYVPPFFDEETSADEPNEAPRLAAEPRIKVGLWRPEGQVQVVSYDDDYRVVDGVTGEQLGILHQRHLGRLTFDEDTDQYGMTGDDLDITSPNYLRLEPIADPHATFVLYNYERRVSWKGPGNFNRYRGALEFRHGEINPDLWVVNDLLFHDYAKGIGENANSSPIEYLKAQSVAQVSYAYAIQQSDKYGIFDVVATTGDQLYLGYEVEKLMPNFVAAVDAVRGYMVTYKNEPVITPYFAHTNGRTLDWTSVWGGSHKPWLVSVAAPYDAGRGLLGHGVGMSQIDASLRAKNDGWDWKQILGYYYTDTSVTKMYD